jgi:hypothetical protein
MRRTKLQNSAGLANSVRPSEHEWLVAREKQQEGFSRISRKKEKYSGGESGIRTHVRVSPKHAFQACAFSHSAISPAQGWDTFIIQAAFCPRAKLGKPAH